MCAFFLTTWLHHPSVLHYRNPLEVCTGITPDISALLEYTFYEPVYYLSADTHFPSSSNEKPGRFVGIAETVGDALTYKILTDDTKKIIYRSAIRTATTDQNHLLP